MITLVIHQNATKYFKDRKEVKVEVKDYHSLMSFLVNSFPKFAEFVKQNKNKLTTDFFILNKNKKRVSLADVEANKKLNDEVYYLVPSIVGGGGKGGQTNPGGNALNGSVNTGGGGGGGGGNSPQRNGGNGGTGVVILSMADADYTGTTTGSPTVATGVSGKTVLTFNASGSYTA